MRHAPIWRLWPGRDVVHGDDARLIVPGMSSRAGGEASITAWALESDTYRPSLCLIRPKASLQANRRRRGDLLRVRQDCARITLTSAVETWQSVRAWRGRRLGGFPAFTDGECGTRLLLTPPPAGQRHWVQALTGLGKLAAAMPPGGASGGMDKRLGIATKSLSFPETCPEPAILILRWLALL